MIEWAINELWPYAKGNPGDVITSIATVVIAGSSICTYLATRTIANENKILRKSNERPELIAYMERQAFYPEIGYYDLVLANLGTGPAKNVAFHIDENYRENFIKGNYNNDLCDIAGLEIIGSINPGERVRFEMGAMIQRPEGEDYFPFKFEVKYRNFLNTEFKYCTKIDPSKFRNFKGFHVPELELCNSLKEIERHLSKDERES